MLEITLNRSVAIVAASELRADIGIAAGRLRQNYGSGRELKRLPDYLWENETVDTLCIGTYGRGQGILALTNRRLLFLHLGTVGGATEEDFPFSRISSIKWSTGMISGSIKILLTGNSEADIKNVNHADGKTMTDRIRSVLAGDYSPGSVAVAAAPPPPPPPPGIPAGWYPDADNDKLLRYWDGQNWTEHTAPNQT